MSRIRSIHPGLFTDESFMSASAHARLMLMGLWVEAWDDGVFEIKPLTLKARIFPVDAIDVGALIVELEGLNFLKRFSAGGKPYAAIRNFRKWQRPKTPNSSGVLPADFRQYVGLDAAISETVPNHFRDDSEKSPQREEEGRRKKEVEYSVLRTGAAAPPPPPPPVDPEKELFRLGKEVLGKSAGGVIANLLKAKGVEQAMAVIDAAKGKENPAEYVGGVLRKARSPPNQSPDFGMSPLMRAARNLNDEFTGKIHASGSAASAAEGSGGVVIDGQFARIAGT